MVVTILVKAPAEEHITESRFRHALLISEMRVSGETVRSGNIVRASLQVKP
jgi:hypothetical protein